MTPTTLIVGNTYAVKDSLKALGGRWDAARKGWRVPAARAAEAQALVADAPKKSSHTAITRHHSHCAECGVATHGRCRDCNIERRPGGSRYMGGMSYHYTDGQGRRQFVLGDDD